MARRQDDLAEEAASKALLDQLTEKGEKREKSDAKKDDPFLDEDGDLKVVPTWADLSSLVTDDASLNALPMREILRRNLQVTLRATEMAEIAYHANPRQGTATALTQMQNMTRDLIAAIEDRQDPRDLSDEIERMIIRPLVEEFVKVLTSEAERKRATLLAITPPESVTVVTHEMKDLLAGVSQGMDDAFDDGRRRLETLLCSKVKKSNGKG
jgi:hypothetical protein